MNLGLCAQAGAPCIIATTLRASAHRSGCRIAFLVASAFCCDVAATIPSGPRKRKLVTAMHEQSSLKLRAVLTILDLASEALAGPVHMRCRQLGRPAGMDRPRREPAGA